MPIHPPVLLGRSDFFKSLKPANQRRLAEICVPKSLRKREILFQEGDEGQSLYFCARGSIQLHKTAASGQEVVIKVIRPGELFAEAVLFEKQRYPVTAVALETGFVYRIPKTEFQRLLDDREFRDDFIANLLVKLRYLADQVQVLTSLDVEGRLFRFLEDRFGNSGDIPTALTKKDVAAAIGTTPETLSRILQKLADSDRLSWKGGRIRIGRADNGLNAADSRRRTAGGPSDHRTPYRGK
jgi:CRP-like cAMP-binding protein